MKNKTYDKRIGHIQKFEIREADSETGSFKGIGAATDVYIPGYNEIVRPGAFKRTLKNNGGKVPLYYNHDSGLQLGWMTGGEETKRGLEVEGKMLVDDIVLAREVHALIKSGKDLGIDMGLSMGFFCINDEIVDLSNKRKGVRAILEAQLIEMSITNHPANPKAKITKVRNELGIQTERLELMHDDDTEVRFMLIAPSEFDTDARFECFNFKLSSPRIYGIVGTLKGEDTPTLQSLRFPKSENWTVDAVSKWIADNQDVTKRSNPDDLNFEYIKPVDDEAAIRSQLGINFRTEWLTNDTGDGSDTVHPSATEILEKLKEINNF